MKNIYYFDMDGVLANFHKEPYNYRNAINKEWIANLDPWVENVAYINDLLTKGESVYILSLAASKEAKQGKIEWLRKYVPTLPRHRIIIIVGNGKKSQHRKTKYGLLIDDKASNCKEWERAGLPSICLAYKGQPIKNLQ